MEWTSQYFVMVGRPMMVVPYCIVINMMLPLYNLRKKEELLVLKYLYVSSVARGGAGVAVAPPEHLRKKLAPFQLSPFLKLFLNFNINLLS